jgi:hypothetical protein
MIAKAITINPAVLKNIPDCEVLLIFDELKLKIAKTGNVPRAKNSIVRPPLKKLPEERVYRCRGS